MKQHTIRPSLDLESESVPRRPAHLNAPISIARPARRFTRPGRLASSRWRGVFHDGGAAGATPAGSRALQRPAAAAARQGAARLLHPPTPQPEPPNLTAAPRPRPRPAPRPRRPAPANSSTGSSP